MLWVRRKILSAGNDMTNSRFTFNVLQGQIVGGRQLKGYMNPFAMSGGPQENPVMVHPNMPPVTVMFLSDSVPYALNNITNVLQIRTCRGYYRCACRHRGLLIAGCPAVRPSLLAPCRPGQDPPAAPRDGRGPQRHAPRRLAAG